MFFRTSLHFNQVAQGQSGGIEYWTGVVLLNDSGERVTKPRDLSGRRERDRTVQVRLDPFEQRVALLSELLGESRYSPRRRLFRITASKPISASGSTATLRALPRGRSRRRSLKALKAAFVEMLPQRYAKLLARFGCGRPGGP